MALLNNVTHFSRYSQQENVPSRKAVAISDCSDSMRSAVLENATKENSALGRFFVAMCYPYFKTIH
jgi:hypothetical protein